MDGRQAQRLRAGRYLNTHLIEAEARAYLESTDATADVIVCLTDDPIEWALEQVQRAGGRGILVLPSKRTFKAALVAFAPDGDDPLDVQPVAEGVEVGMLFHLIDAAEGDFYVRVTKDRHVALVPA